MRALRAPGNMVIQEEDYVLELSELHLSPKAHWRPKHLLPSPEPSTESKSSHSVSACWAPDDSAILLRYELEDVEDVRAGWGDDSCFEVGCLPCWSAQSACPAVCHSFAAPWVSMQAQPDWRGLLEPGA